MGFLNKIKPIKPDKELQAEFKALVMTCLAKQYMYSDDEDRYERLLKEIYLRGLEPELTIKIKLNK